MIRLKTPGRAWSVPAGAALLLCAAQHGDADAQLHVHAYSQVFRLSEAEAQSWFGKAAANGDADALREQGMRLLEAEGKPTARILELFRQARD